VVRSKAGKVLVALRDEESRTRFLGYRVEHYKTFVFTLSAVMAAVAGALYVPQVGIINPSEFAPANSIEIVIWVAVGGRGTLIGAALGAVLVNYAKTTFTTGLLAPYWLFALGGLFVLVTIFLPKGILGALARRRFGRNASSDRSATVAADVRMPVGRAGDRPLSRRYTIRSLDHARRLLELNIVSHGIDGPGARWAEAAEPGSRINGVGPRGKIFLDLAADWHLFLADASGAPASLAMLEALPPDVPAFALLELSHALPHSVTGKHTVQWLLDAPLADALRTFRLPEGQGHAYIAGEVQQVNALREIAIQLGLTLEQVSAKAYWGRGKPNAPRGEPESS